MDDQGRITNEYGHKEHWRSVEARQLNMQRDRESMQRYRESQQNYSGSGSSDNSPVAFLFFLWLMMIFFLYAAPVALYIAAVASFLYNVATFSMVFSNFNRLVIALIATVLLCLPIVALYKYGYDNYMLHPFRIITEHGIKTISLWAIWDLAKIVLGHVVYTLFTYFFLEALAESNKSKTR